MGRPKGSKNKNPYHKAGGDRRSKRFKSTQQQKRVARMMAQIRIRDALAGRNAGGSTTKNKRTPHPLEEHIYQRTQQMMRNVLDHPSMPKAKNAPTNGTIDTASDGWYINYDDDEEEEDDEDFDDTSTHYRSSYQPSLQTPLKICLDQVCKKIQRNENLQMQKYVIVQKSSPLASGLGSDPTPDEFYKPDFIVNWDPIKQYPVFAVKYKCPSCKDGLMDKKGPCWRPALNWGEVHWIRCHRVSCKECSSTFMTTDAEIMESLPSAIVDDFGYVFPRRGPGVVTDMIRDLSLQTSNHVLFGAWAKHINDIIWQRYFRKQNQYMQLLKNWLDDWPSLATYDGNCPLHAWGYDGSPMVPYSAFGESGYHNGILMTAKLAKQLFFLVEGGKRMEYNQNSFGRWHDGGLRVDDTYKICKKVVVTTSGRQKVNPFSSAATFLSQEGKIVAIAWKMTGSHAVTRDILRGIKLVRDHVGAPPLKVLQTDNPQGEEAPFYEVFPSLKDGTVSPSTLPAIEIPQDDILTFDSVGPANNFFLTLASCLPATNHDIIYGLDTEFEITPPQELTVLSLAFPQSLIVATDDQRLPRAIVLHLYKMNGSFPASLKQILEQKNWIPAGCQIGGDCSKLQDQYNIKITRRIELQNMCKFDRPDLAQIVGGYRLGTLMEQYLGCTYPMDKSKAQVQSYMQSLSEVDKQYCALDALVSLWVYQAALSSLAKVGGAHQHMTLQVGKRCTVTFSGRDIAKGRVVFIGTSGEQRLWGGKTLGKSDCLVRIENLIDKDFEPRRREIGWPESARTIGDLSACDGVTLELAMQVKQVKILEEVEPSSDATTLTTRREFEVDKNYLRGLIDEVQRSEDNQEEEAQDSGPNNEIENLGSFLTRSTRDFFHQLHSIPMGKKTAGLPSLLELVISASCHHNEEDYESVTSVLRAKGEDISVHQHFNRDYWRERVRTASPLPMEHGKNIRMIKDIVEKREAYKDVRSPQLLKWFETFAENAEKGLYYKPTDMNMYKLDRVDKDGLNVYKTDEGTNLNEALHQKLADLLGLMVVGIETADILLILRAFRFNISAGISRCGEPDFHTDRHDVVDKTQHWIMHLFGIFAWPTHTNLLDFDPPKDSTLVGCRPLPFDENHVTKAARPAANLSRDHMYLSGKLGVEIAPLPLSTKEEFKLYNSLVRKIVQQNRNPNHNDFDNIARTFKQKVDGAKIFPKTVDHLKKYYTTWKHIQNVRLFSRRALNDTASLLQKFQSVRVAPPKLVTNQLPAKVQTISYTAGKAMEKMKNVVPPESAFTQRSHVPLESKEVKKRKLADDNANSYQHLLTMTKHQLKKHSQRCAWYPYCRHQAWSCGGYNQNTECSFIKRLTTSMREEVKSGILTKTTSKKSLQRRKQRSMKKCMKNNGRVDVPLVTEVQTVPSVYHSRTKRGFIVTEDMMMEVATVGMPVRNECVSAYLSLFINEVHSSGKGDNLGLVDSGFMGHLSASGFGDVCHWLTRKTVQMIPAFFGPNDYGHWTALILDSESNEQKAVVAFVDSLSDRNDRFQVVKRDLSDSYYSEAYAQQVMIDSPIQAGGSNDCAFFTIGAFVHWAFRGTKDVPTKFQFRHTYDASRFGIEMRKHVYTSILNGTVDLDAPILRAMELSYQ